MKFAIDRFTLIVDHLECVTAVSIHVTITIWSATVAEEEANLFKELVKKILVVH